MARIECRHFSGYKPCVKNESCDRPCSHFEKTGARIAIVHLGALGAVLRSTSLLPSIRRKFPRAHITWITQNPAQKLLESNPLVDRILTTKSEDLMVAQALKFDVVIGVDKSLQAGAIIKGIDADMHVGFGIHERSGAIVPFNTAAKELWELGLSNQKKFFENKKTENQLMVEAFELGRYQRDGYVVGMSQKEKELSLDRRREWLGHQNFVIGINTGCASTIAYKKMTVDQHRKLIQQLMMIPKVSVVLLGGPEDRVRNEQIGYGLPVIQSPTNYGLRDGLCSVEACDVVVSGDSLGMHMGIALKKWVVAWFGPTCSHEIELYDRGVKVLANVECSPCWKRLCVKERMCYDQVDLKEVVSGVKKGLEWTTSLFKRPSLETYFSVFPL